MPFIFANCGEDLAYDRSAAAEEESVDADEDEVSECDLNEFLVADCVDEFEAENADDSTDDADADDENSEEDADAEDTSDSDDTSTE